MEGLDRSRCKTDVVQIVGLELVNQFELRHADIVGINKAQTRWSDFAVFIEWVGSGCSFEHVQDRGMKLFSSILVLFFAFFSHDLVLAIDHVRVLQKLILNGECVRELAYDRAF